MVRPYPSKKFDQLQPAKGRNKKQKSTVFILSSMVEPANHFIRQGFKEKIARRLMKNAGLSSSDEEDMPLVKMIKVGMVQDNSNGEYDEYADGIKDTEDIVVNDLDVEMKSRCDEGDFCLVEHTFNETRKVHYVSKLLTNKEEQGVVVSNMRKSQLSTDEVTKFVVLQIPDINLIVYQQIKELLLKPATVGGTARQKSTCRFLTMVFPV